MEDALLQPLPVHGEGQGAPHVAVPEGGVGPRRVAVGGQVEGEVAVRGASVRIDRELRCGAGPLHVGGRSQELEGVRLPGDELREGGLGIRREPPDQPPDVGPAEEKRRVGDELDTFPGLPRDEAVRPVAHRRPAERRAHPLVAGDAREQVGRQDAHVVHGVEEHLGVAAAEPELDGERVSRHRGHRPDGAQRFAGRRVDARIGVRVERERDVAGGDRRAVLPACLGREMKDEGERIPPRPPVRQLRPEVRVSQGERPGPQVGELQEDLVVDVARHRLLRNRRQQDVRLAESDEDEGAAVLPAAGAGALAAGERQRQRGAHGHREPYQAARIEVVEPAPTEVMKAAYTSGRHWCRSASIWARACSRDSAGR